jgi:hypothetical protein|tara:strand:- start:4510 stop:5259 length:750 start_codon:yes stop_codon:yes gene_type:complete
MKKPMEFVARQYKLTREAAPLSFMLPTRNSRRFPLMYFDEDTGENRALRYAKNQKSPFEDEQDGNAILEPVIFEDGFLNVGKENQVLQKFLSLHPLNGKRFVEVDEAKDAAAIVNILNLEVDALIEARNLSVDMVENVSRVLFGTDTSRTSTAELRRDILVYAKREPQNFINILGDPMLKLQANVALFFEKGLLAFRKNRKEVWFNTSTNKTRMLTVPYGEEPMFIVASYLQSDEGIDVLKMLEKMLEK